MRRRDREDVTRSKQMTNEHPERQANYVVTVSSLLGPRSEILDKPYVCDSRFFVGILDALTFIERMARASGWRRFTLDTVRPEEIRDIPLWEHPR